MLKAIKSILDKITENVPNDIERVEQLLDTRIKSNHRKKLLFQLENLRQEAINSKKIALKITNHKKHLLKVKVG